MRLRTTADKREIKDFLKKSLTYFLKKAFSVSFHNQYNPILRE